MINFTNISLTQLDKRISYTIETDEHSNKIIPIEFVFNNKDSEYPECVIKHVIDGITIYSNIEIEDNRFVETFVMFYNMIWNKSTYYLSKIQTDFSLFYLKECIKYVGIDNFKEIKTRCISFSLFMHKYNEAVLSDEINEDI